MASPGPDAATPILSLPSGCGPEFWNKLTGIRDDSQRDPGRRHRGQEVIPAVNMARQPAAFIQPPIAGREEHVVHARRGIGCQLEDRLAILITELLADGREQALAAVAGMTCRQPAATISGVNRPHVADLATARIDDADLLAAADADRLPGLGSHDHHPLRGTRPCHLRHHSLDPDPTPPDSPALADAGRRVLCG